MNTMLTVISCVAILSVPAFAAEQDEVLQPLHQFVDGMNRGDQSTALAACGEDMSIIDNVAPYAWHGKDACRQWADAQDLDAEQKGMTDTVFKIGGATHFETSTDHAYAVLPASYTFKKEGKPGRVEGTLTTALQKGPGGWRMTGFAFSER